MTMARTIKLYKLPDKPSTPGIRLLEKRDVPQANFYLNMLHLLQILSGSILLLYHAALWAACMMFSCATVSGGTSPDC